MKHKTTVMGILNITPDSFSDGGEYYDTQKAVERAKEMITEEVDIIDIGGESTRPGAEAVTAEEEIKRVVPVIKAIRYDLDSDIQISIDTYKSQVAIAALSAGATIVNSLGGFTFDKKLVDVVKEYDCRIIVYHIKGEPRTMQKGEIVYKDVVGDISEFFKQQIDLGIKNGLRKDQFILDPGIGFGKTVEQNIEIIKRLKEFQSLELPVLIGVSRKSHLGKLLQTKLELKELPYPTERLEASLAETAVAVLNGASIVRTHDILTTRKFLSVIDEFIENT